MDNTPAQITQIPHQAKLRIQIIALILKTSTDFNCIFSPLMNKTAMSIF